MVYKMHKCIKHIPISAGEIKKKKKKSTDIKHEINIMNIIIDNT